MGFPASTSSSSISTTRISAFSGNSRSPYKCSRERTPHFYPPISRNCDRLRACQPQPNNTLVCTYHLPVKVRAVRVLESAESRVEGAVSRALVPALELDVVDRNEAAITPALIRLVLGDRLQNDLRADGNIYEETMNRLEGRSTKSERGLCKERNSRG